MKDSILIVGGGLGGLTAALALARYGRPATVLEGAPSFGAIGSIWMRTFQTQLLNEIQAGHDGPTIPESKRVYFQQRLRDRFFDFVTGRFLREQTHGLTKAKLARRIGKPPEVVNRWLAAPTNLTLDSISDLLLGICAEELEMDGHSVLNRQPTNYFHMADQREPKVKTKTTSGSRTFTTLPAPG